MEEQEKLEALKKLANREVTLEKVCEKLELTDFEVLGLISKLREQGINISTKTYDDGVHLFNQGEKDLEENHVINFETNETHEFKFVAISDTRFGSKAQQLSILNDIYKKAKEMGYDKVIHCGNITEGLYPMSNAYADTTFLDDSLRQVDYIAENYPKVDGITTYFITGSKDSKHMKNNKINIGKRISDARDDMIYLGDKECNVIVDNANILVSSPDASKTYTVSYRPQKQIDAFRSEDKPDVFLYGGLLQMEKFNYRDVECISVPSCCATTQEMSDKKYANTVGAVFVTVKTDEKGNLLKVDATEAIYKDTIKNDYQKGPHIITSHAPVTTSEHNDEYRKLADKFYHYIQNGMPIEQFMDKFRCNYNELNGMLEICRMYGKQVDIVESNGNFVLQKILPTRVNTGNGFVDLNKLNHTELCVVSDTHFGNIHQQLHLLNNMYEEAYKRGITTVLHCGDVVDGNYPNRPENPRQQFLHGFDEQAGYVVDMYPKVRGITTKYILGSHDETHYKNGQATINNWVSRCRPDMIFLGQDTGTVDIDNLKIIMDHPGGGSAQALSYKPQKRIENLETLCKPDILLMGHYHKGYSFVYHNVHGIEVPALCDKTQFQQKQGLANYVGGYFLDIYYDDEGNIHLFKPEQILYGQKDMWDEAGKDRNKVKQLVIN